MIWNNLAKDITVAQRIKTLQELKFVHFTKISEYEKMPDVKPLNDQLHFFEDGIEAIVNNEVTQDDVNKYTCWIIDDKKKKVIEYIFEGRGYKPFD